MANYRGKAPLTRQDLRRAKQDAKRARMNKMGKSVGTAKRGLFFNNKLWIIIGACAIGLAAIGMVVFIITQRRPSDDELLAYLENGVFTQTTIIEDMDVSGKTIDEARTLLADTVAAELDAAAIQFAFNDTEYTETARAVGLMTDVEDVLIDAMLFEKAGPVFERSKNQRTAAKDGAYYDISVVADEETVTAAVEKILPAYAIAAQEPTMSFNPDAETEDEFITWSDEVVGMEINHAAFVAAVISGVEQAVYNIGDVQTDLINPQHTKAAVEGSVVKLSEYTTFFGYGEFKDDERVFNISYMAEMLTGSTVEPGEDWSVNDTTGPRTEDAGWKEAHAIRHGALEDELGGGVCQVSGTLYNAFLLADLGIVERHEHTYPSDYINKVGKDQVYGDSWRYSIDHVAVDATIDYLSGKDLVIRNTLSDTIYIVVVADQEAMTVSAKIYGPPPENDYQIVIKTFKTKDLAPSADPEIRVAVDGLAPDGTYVYPGEPYAYVKRVNGSSWVTYKYYYPKDYVMYEDEENSWIGYVDGDTNSGEKYRLKFEDSDKYIDSTYPAQAGVYYYNPRDPETEGMEGSTYDPNAPAEPAGGGTDEATDDGTDDESTTT